MGHRRAPIDATDVISVPLRNLFQEAGAAGDDARPGDIPPLLSSLHERENPAEDGVAGRATCHFLTSLFLFVTG